MTNTSILALPGAILSVILTIGVSLVSLHFKDIFTAASLSGSASNLVAITHHTGITNSRDVGIDLHNHVDKQTSRSILNLPKTNSLQSDARSLQRLVRSEEKRVSKRHNSSDGWRYLLSVFAGSLS